MVGPGAQRVANVVGALGVSETDDVESEYARVLGKGGNRVLPVRPRRYARTGAVQQQYGCTLPDIVIVGTRSLHIDEQAFFEIHGRRHVGLPHVGYG